MRRARLLNSPSVNRSLYHDWGLTQLARWPCDWECDPNSLVTSWLGWETTCLVTPRLWCSSPPGDLIIGSWHNLLGDLRIDIWPHDCNPAHLVIPWLWYDLTSLLTLWLWYDSTCVVTPWLRFDASGLMWVGCDLNSLLTPWTHQSGDPRTAMTQPTCWNDD